MYNSKNIGNRIGGGCWSGFCKNPKNISQNNSCANLSGKIISSGVLSNINKPIYRRKK
jgi:hypothetical protein